MPNPEKVEVNMKYILHMLPGSATKNFKIIINYTKIMIREVSESTKIRG